MSVRCYEQQAAFRLRGIIFGQNGGRGKTERERIVRFSIRYRVIRLLLFRLLISLLVRGIQQAMSAFQRELSVFTGQTLSMRYKLLRNEYCAVFR